MQTIERFLVRAERLNLALAVGAVCVGGLVWGPTWTYVSLAAGGLLSVLNLRAIAYMGRRLLQGGVSGRNAAAALFGVKFAVLAVLCYVAVVVAGVEIVPFMIGASTLLIALPIAAAGALGGAAGHGPLGAASPASPARSLDA